MRLSISFNCIFQRATRLECYPNLQPNIQLRQYQVQPIMFGGHCNNVAITKGSLLAIALIFIVGIVQCIQVEHYGAQYYEQEPLQHYHVQPKPAARKPKGQDFSKIPGTPGVDFPILHEVPHTNFHCGNVPATPGMYANVETGCQAYHVCHDGREGHQGASFLCTNGTIFNQKEFTCDWWYNVNCAEAQSYYHLNADPEHNPYFPKKKPEEEHHAKFLIDV